MAGTIIHGMSYSPEYKAWMNTKDRCTNPNYKGFAQYGGRGISVCDRWANSFENFFADMGERPSPSHSVDRINNDLGYSPDNCRWASLEQQARNRGKLKSNTSGVNGVTQCRQSKKYRANIYANKTRHELGRFDTLAEAKDARLAAEARYWGK